MKGMNDMNYYLLFSDGTWATVSDESKIDTIVEHHRFPFPIDRKGDHRRWVKIFPADSIDFYELRKNI